VAQIYGKGLIDSIYRRGVSPSDTGGEQSYTMTGKNTMRGKEFDTVGCGGEQLEEIEGIEAEGKAPARGQKGRRKGRKNTNPYTTKYIPREKKNVEGKEEICGVKRWGVFVKIRDDYYKPRERDSIDPRFQM